MSESELCNRLINALAATGWQDHEGGRIVHVVDGDSSGNKSLCGVKMAEILFGGKPSTIDTICCRRCQKSAQRILKKGRTP